MVRAALASLGSALGLVVGAPLVHADEVDHHDDMVELPRALAFERGAPNHVARNVTLYVNGDGATVTGGWDDSASNVSSVAWNAGADVHVPAFGGSRARWKQVVKCVKDRFADFAIDVVTTRPADRDYVMIMVGGHPSMFGYPESVGGIAPYTGQVLHTAIGYVFSENLQNDVETTCVSILHEAGHTLGLDHLYLCEDPMSYLWGCGEKRWQDQYAYCGEGEARMCGDGEATQNSYRRLVDHVGLRDEPVGGDPEPEPEPQPEPEPGSEDDPYDPPHDPDDGGCGWMGCAEEDDEDWADSTAPQVTIDADGEAEAPGNRWIEVVVRASDDRGVADVELGWSSETAQYVLQCGAMPADMPATCTRDGDVFRYQLYVGTGMRAVAARATDLSGNQAVSETYGVYLTGE